MKLDKINAVGVKSRPR